MLRFFKHRIKGVEITENGHLVWNHVREAKSYRLTLELPGTTPAPISTTTADMDLTAQAFPPGTADINALLQAFDSKGKQIAQKLFTIHSDGDLTIKKANSWRRTLLLIGVFAFLIAGACLWLYLRNRPVQAVRAEPDIPSASATNEVSQEGTTADNWKKKVEILRQGRVSSLPVQLNPQIAGEQTGDLIRKILEEVEKLHYGQSNLVEAILGLTDQGNLLNKISGDIVTNQTKLNTRMDRLAGETSNRLSVLEKDVSALREKLKAAPASKPEPPSGLTITPSPHVVVPGPSASSGAGSITAGPSGSPSPTLMTIPQGGITINSSNTYIQAPGGLLGWRPEVPGGAPQAGIPAQELCLKVPSGAVAQHADECVSFWVPLTHTPLDVLVDPGWVLHISGMPAGVRLEGYLRNYGFIPYDPYDTRFLTKDIAFLRFTLRPDFRPLYIKMTTLPEDTDRSVPNVARPIPSPCP